MADESDAGAGDAATSGRLRWGVIGTGQIAHAFVADLVHSQACEIVAVGSRSQESADAFGDRHRVPHRHPSYEALAGDPDVDAVYVATPHPMHHANALHALEAGKHVLVEKAFTMNAAEAADLVRAAADLGLFLMEAMWTRFLPQVAEIQRLLTEGSLGQLVSVTADHGQWFPEDPNSRLFAPELGGGALLDLGVYPVSFASMVLGPPERISSMVTPAFTGVDGQTSILLGYAGGAQAILTCTTAAASATRASIVGTQARIDCDGPFYAPGGFTVTPRGGEPTRIQPPHEGLGLHYEATEVARCIRAGLTESPLMPLAETVSIMQTMDAVLGGAAG